MEPIKVREAARRLGISRQRVYQLIEQGVLENRASGEGVILDAADLEKPEVKNRKIGRPAAKTLDN